jgi:hypothetical protein
MLKFEVLVSRTAIHPYEEIGLVTVAAWNEEEARRRVADLLENQDEQIAWWVYDAGDPHYLDEKVLDVEGLSETEASR